MTGSRNERTGELLRQALPAVDAAAEPGHELWPQVRARMAEAEPVWAIPWYDWALAGALGGLLVAAPRVLPLLLYYL